MACFLVPAAEAVVTTIATKVLEKKECKGEHATQDSHDSTELTVSVKEPFSHKLKRLNGLLWGGSALLAFEHLWHGEIKPFFPFLTAAEDASEAAEMLHEMSTVGVTMAVLTTAVWGVMTFVAHKMSTRKSADTVTEE